MKTEEQQDTELLARDAAQWILSQQAVSKGQSPITYAGKQLNNMEALLVGLMSSAGQGNTQAATTLLTLGGVIGKRDGQNTAEGKRMRAERRKKAEQRANAKAAELRNALRKEGKYKESNNALVRLTAQNILIAERANLDALACDELVHIEYSREGAERTTANPILNIAMQATSKALDGLNDLAMNQRQQMKSDVSTEDESEALSQFLDALRAPRSSDDEDDED